jgi:hypothetical protein
MIGKHVKVSGPLFDGRAAKAVHDFCVEFAEGYADDVNAELQRQFSRVFKNPTGRYEARVRARRVGTGVSEVKGNVTPYGAWLEGTSPRNQKSSFKGYGSFKVVAPKMDRRAKAVANAEFRARYLRRINGGWL